MGPLPHQFQPMILNGFSMVNTQEKTNRPLNTPKVPQKYEYERISFNEQVVIRVKLRYVAGVCWNFLRIFFPTFLHPKLSPSCWWGWCFVPAKRGSFTWQVWSSSLADDDDKKSPDNLVNSEAKVSKKWPTNFQVHEFCFGESEFFCNVSTHNYTYHTVDGRNPALVAK